MRFESTHGGVRVITAAGIVLGTAPSYGGRLTSDEAMAHLGLAERNGRIVTLDADEKLSILTHGASERAGITPHERMDRRLLEQMAEDLLIDTRPLASIGAIVEAIKVARGERG